VYQAPRIDADRGRGDLRPPEGETVPLRRLVMLRHGETVGNSSVRFHGASDVPLSDAGRAQLRAAARGLRQEFFDLVVASPLRRSWEGAALVAPGAPVRIEDGLREIDFGRWEGLSAEEIEQRDPVLYREWRERKAAFEYPGGEPRAGFRARVRGAFERIEASGAHSALLVAHKGVIRSLVDHLTGAPLADGEPELAEAVGLSRGPDGRWFLGRRGSEPAV
jgi:broad specificity phosphatase PhoE